MATRTLKLTPKDVEHLIDALYFDGTVKEPTRGRLLKQLLEEKVDG